MLVPLNHSDIDWLQREISPIGVLLLGISLVSYAFNIFHSRHHRGGKVYFVPLLDRWTIRLYHVVDATFMILPQAWREYHNASHHVVTNHPVEEYNGQSPYRNGHIRLAGGDTSLSMSCAPKLFHNATARFDLSAGQHIAPRRALYIFRFVRSAFLFGGHSLPRLGAVEKTILGCCLEPVTSFPISLRYRTITQIWAEDRLVLMCYSR